MARYNIGDIVSAKIVDRFVNKNGVLVYRLSGLPVLFTTYYLDEYCDVKKKVEENENGKMIFKQDGGITLEFDGQISQKLIESLIGQTRWKIGDQVGNKKIIAVGRRGNEVWYTTKEEKIEDMSESQLAAWEEADYLVSTRKEKKENEETEI